MGKTARKHRLVMCCLAIALTLAHAKPAFAQHYDSPRAMRWELVTLNTRILPLLTEEVPGRRSLLRSYTNETVKDAQRAIIADDYGNRPKVKLSSAGKLLFAGSGLAVGLSTQSNESGTKKLLFGVGGALAGEAAATAFENTVRAIKASQEMTVRGGAVIIRSTRREVRMGAGWQRNFATYFYDRRNYAIQMPSGRYVSAVNDIKGAFVDYDIPVSGSLLSARAGVTGMGGPTGWSGGAMLAPESINLTLEGDYSKLDGPISSRRTALSLGFSLPLGIDFPVTFAVSRDDIGIADSQDSAAFRDDAILLKLAPHWDSNFYLELSGLWGRTRGYWLRQDNIATENVDFNSGSRQLSAAVGQLFHNDAGDTAGEIKLGISQDKNYTWAALSGAYYSGNSEEISFGMGLGINIALKQLSELHYYGTDGLKLSTIPSLWLGIKY